MQFIYDRNAAGLKLMKELGANLDILDKSGDPLVTSVAFTTATTMMMSKAVVAATPAMLTRNEIAVQTHRTAKTAR